MNLEIVIDHFCNLGEGPVWDAAREMVLWVDIVAGEVHQYSPTTRAHSIFKADQMVGAVAVRENGSLVVALQKGVAFLDLEQGTQQWVIDVEPLDPKIRLNEAKCDPAGNLWAGTMELTSKPGAGKLYMLSPDCKLSVKILGVTVSNGMAWSADGSTFYYIDTPTQQVMAYDYDVVTGHIQNSRTAIYIPQDMGKPDGMTIDQQGMLWVALWNGWGIGRWNPLTGELLYKIELPVARVTSCTFGGKDLTDLYITTAKIGASEQELERQPLAGALFIIKNSGFKGVPTNLFKG